MDPYETGNENLHNVKKESHVRHSGENFLSSYSHDIWIVVQGF